MSFKRGDVVTFADDDKVLVFEALLHNGVIGENVTNYYLTVNNGGL